MSVPDKETLMLGLDVGSVAFKAVVTDADGKLLQSVYRRTRGRPIEVAAAVLRELLDRWGAGAFDLAAGTGSAGATICRLLDLPFVNEVICQATAVRFLLPQVRTLLEMGGQDSKLIFLSDEQSDGNSNGRPLRDFAMNSNCAAGTGSFLDQQASRLGIRIEEFGKLALLCESAPTVAGRCSVFAKSDMIHLQQRATPTADIVAGLCVGLVRSLKSSLARGTQPQSPIAFCGGVAANQGVVRALQQVFELQPGQLIVPECHAVTGALGAVLVGLKERARSDGARSDGARSDGARSDGARSDGGRSDGGRSDGGRTGNRRRELDLSPLQQYLEKPHSIGHRLTPLSKPSCNVPDDPLPDRRGLEARAANGPIEAYLGLDVGSISTKIAVIDSDQRVLAKCYLMTAGRPLEAVRKVLKNIGQRIGDLVDICGAASTGSGRYLTGDFIGTDLVINEITAQAAAAAAIDPQVDTVFEIGGQDSKYISLDHGVVVDFEMNHACAAGTGSFLEEQAERLDISIKEQFGRLALASRNPVRLGERCTVFMESDLLGYQQQGAATDDLVAGLSYSIVNNYMNRVVGNRRVGKRIFFQGGTAFNLGVLAAFEKVTGREITVPPHHEVTGAIGAALLARRHQRRSGCAASRFGGFELADSEYKVRSFKCDACSNDCEINELLLPRRQPLFYGSRCDRFNVEKNDESRAKIPDLFAQRHRLLLRHANIKSEEVASKSNANRKEASRIDGRPTVGIPLALLNYELLPLWATLLGELGFRVVLSPPSTRRIIRRGVEAVLSTPCFPVKVAHGHVFELLDREVDYLWIPSVANMPHEDDSNREAQLCPYISTLPYQIAAALEHAGRSAEILKPLVRLRDGRRGLREALASLGKQLGLGGRQIRGAVEKAWRAQEAFEKACRRRGREVLDALAPNDRAIVLISRPYNGCDPAVYLDLPNKLRALGAMPIPLDFLDLRPHGSNGNAVLRQMYWKYGQRVLRAAELLRKDPRLHAIYLSNFSCGPDSFLTNYFRRRMSPKPTLVLEIDEHSADAGVVTRLEAFLQSLGNSSPPSPRRETSAAAKPSGNGKPRTIFVPWMGDQSHGMAAAFRAYGQHAEVIPIADQESLELGRRFTNGKECLPCIITTGDMVRVTQRKDVEPHEAAFLMPGGSGPCRFGQYSCLHRLILDDLDLGDAQVLSPAQDGGLYKEWGRLQGDIVSLGWYGICVFDILLKAALATRPYERRPGSTDAVYAQSSRRVCQVIETQPTEKQLIECMARAAERFAAIETDRGTPRPRIGVVGEIYVRLHSFANNDLIRHLERLGAEVSLASYPEWHYYTNWVRMNDARRQRNLLEWLVNYQKDRIQHRRHRRLAAPFAELMGPLDEPPTGKLLKLAAGYLDPSLKGGDAVLSIGKMVEMCEDGCHGVINVMPFSCMPSTVVDGLMKRLARTLGRPAMSISYDGQQDPMLQTRLEAFLYQARACSSNGKDPVF